MDVVVGVSLLSLAVPWSPAAWTCIDALHTASFTTTWATFWILSALSYEFSAISGTTGFGEEATAIGATSGFGGTSRSADRRGASSKFASKFSNEGELKLAQLVVRASAGVFSPEAHGSSAEIGAMASSVSFEAHATQQIRNNSNFSLIYKRIFQTLLFRYQFQIALVVLTVDAGKWVLARRRLVVTVATVLLTRLLDDRMEGVGIFVLEDLIVDVVQGVDRLVAELREEVLAAEIQILRGQLKV